MLKKILTYILSLTLITSQNMMICASNETNTPFLPRIIIEQMSSSLNEKDFYDMDLEIENTNFTEEKSKNDVKDKSSNAVKTWVARSSSAALLALLTAITTQFDIVGGVIEKLERQNIKMSNDNLLCAVTCSAIQGISYTEGINRSGKVEMKKLYNLVKTLVLLRAYHCIDIFFGLDVCISDNKIPDLLKISLTTGDDMVSNLPHDSSSLISDQIKKANSYIDKIKSNFRNLSRWAVFSKLNLYSENTTKNLNSKQGLLESLLFISMESNELDNLVKTVVDDNY